MASTVLEEETETTSIVDVQTPGPAAPRVHRGFAQWADPEKHREAARKGGRAAHAKGTAHRFTSEEARAAALKSAETRRANKARKP